MLKLLDDPGCSAHNLPTCLDACSPDERLESTCASRMPHLLNAWRACPLVLMGPEPTADAFELRMAHCQLGSFLIGLVFSWLNSNHVPS